jgi:protein NrfD
MSIIFLLLIQLSVGSMMTLLAVPLHETGRGYFRFTCIVSLCLWGIAFFLWPYPATVRQELLSGHEAILFTSWAGRTLLLYIIYALLGLLCSFVLTPKRPSLSRKLLGASVLAGILVLICLAMVYRNQLGLGFWWESLLFPGNFLTSALLLGSASLAMVLGHWYLVTPDLSIDPLKSLSLLFIGSLILRLLLILLTLTLYGTGGEASRRLIEILLNSNAYGVFFWFRLLFGLVAPLACTYMIWETVKIHSTQSATGILYITMLFVLAGELLAKFLLFVTKIPL